MEDATIVMNDVDEELVEYFKYVVREENLLYLPTNWKEERELFIHILFIHILFIQTFLFLFYILHSLY